MDYTMLTGWMNDALASAAFTYAFTLGTTGTIIAIAVSVLMVISRWKIFTKAGQPGRWSLIPVYNIYLTFKVAGRPGWWTRWILFPPVLIILLIITCFDIAKRFGKPGIFGLGILLVKVVFVPLLAFDKKAVWTPKKK